MAEDNTIRVVLKVSPAKHPELHQALEEIESSGRAERLRSLALMALTNQAMVMGGFHTADASRAPSKRSSATKRSPVETKTDTTPTQVDKPPVEARDSNEEKPDPHQEVRAALLKGLKNADF